MVKAAALKHRPRDPLIDTGVPGLVLSRRCQSDVQQVTVIVLQKTVDPRTGERRASYPPVGAIGRAQYEACPDRAQSAFEGALSRGLAIKAYHDFLHADGRPPAEVISFEQVPDDFKAPLPSLPFLDLGAILKSCVEMAANKPDRTTNNDAFGQAVELLRRNLTVPGCDLWLNGFRLSFKRYEMEDVTVYIPRMLFRCRNGWRMRVLCTNGIWSARLPDRPGQISPRETLQEAWRTLVLQLLELKPDRSRPNYIGEPLLWTGLEQLHFNVMRSKSSNGQRGVVRFQLRYRYITPMGTSRKVTVGYWNEDALTDESLTQALRKGVALNRFYKSLGESAPEKVSDALDIPDRFWPSHPPIEVTADDLRFYVERLEAGLTLRTRR